jgi:hypothetical protein
MTFTKEPLTVVRIRQPKCSRTFGVAPCNAAGSRCWNTDATCRFRAALDMTAEIVMDFVAKDESHEWIDAPGAYQPALAEPGLIGAPQYAPTELNVADGDDDKASIGLRAVVQIPFADYPHNDVGFDDYLSTRAYDPLTQGTRWGKWLKRNPFYEGNTVEVYEGSRGDALAEMTKRVYRMTKVDRTADQVQVTAKDILSQITDTGVRWPPLSPGELQVDITAVQTAFTVINAFEADYPATGYVRIGDELIAYTSRAGGSGTLTFSGCTRGVLNTTAATQKQASRVQRVIAYEAVRGDAIMKDIIEVGGGIPSAFVPYADWQGETTQWRAEYIFTSYVTEPTLVEDLAGELCASMLMHLWWDERLQQIRFKAQAPEPAPVALDWQADILKGSFKEIAHPEQRASRFILYYRPRSWVGSMSDSTNFQSAREYRDVLAETQYRTATPREMFSRWIQSDALAVNLAGTYVGRFRDVRRKISFSLAAPVVWTGDQVRVTHYADTDFTGAPATNLWLITKAETIIAGAAYAYEAEDNNMVGAIWEWVADTVPEWGAATPEQKATIGYWLDDDGRDLDGNPQPWRWL